MNTLLKRPRSRAALAGLARLDERASTRRAALLALPRMLEEQFSPAAATGLDAVYELRVLSPDRDVQARFRLAVTDGLLSVRREIAPPAEADAWVAIGLGDMIRLVTGEVVLWALMADKRLDLGGEPFTALRFPALFGLR